MYVCVRSGSKSLPTLVPKDIPVPTLERVRAGAHVHTHTRTPAHQATKEKTESSCFSSKKKKPPTKAATQVETQAETQAEAQAETPSSTSTTEGDRNPNTVNREGSFPVSIIRPLSIAPGLAPAAEPGSVPTLESKESDEINPTSNNDELRRLFDYIDRNKNGTQILRLLLCVFPHSSLTPKLICRCADPC